MKDYLLVFTKPAGTIGLLAIKAENSEAAATSAGLLWRTIRSINKHYREPDLYDVQTGEVIRFIVPKKDKK